MLKSDDTSEQVKCLQAKLLWLSKHIIDPQLTDGQIEGIRGEIYTLRQQIHVLTEPVLLADILTDVLLEIGQRQQSAGVVQNG